MGDGVGKQHIVSHRLATIYIGDMENPGRIVAIDVGAKHLQLCDETEIKHVREYIETNPARWKNNT